MKRVLPVLLLLMALCKYSAAQTYQQIPVKSSYALASSFMSGTNLALTLINVAGTEKQRRVSAGVGLLTGLAGIVVGVQGIKKDEAPTTTNGIQSIKTYQANNNWSYVNIAMGTATMISSLFNVFSLPKKPKKTAWNLYSQPGMNNSMAMGVSVTRKF